MRVRVVAGVLLVGIVACARPERAHKPEIKDAAMADASTGVEIIGQARILPDGTLELTMWRPAPGLLRYPKTDPRYASILAHVGPIRPGESVPVRPFPDP